MNLSQIPKGEIVLFDANITLYAMSRRSLQCETMLRRCADHDISCIIPSAQLADLMHQLMIAEAMDNG